ncbi:AraC family transcriptional regulator [Bacillus sp. SA1-12]|uniref:helix-turn-helix transcriptional regulator n=1 Tax=Bacillus sp. SA1-12 TaxID=1455638 RepID=UPI0006272CE8|nr:helix-turn-helix transcriptional regulator [Bacillus sp. SA1-12]KKI89557.1 AraC family transcriptional regulator [Bacillus sp. SA1-12]
MTAHLPKPSMGILNLSKGEEKYLLQRYAPSPDINFFVKHYWIVRWDLTGQDAYIQDVIPNPCINLVIEKNKSAIYGVSKTKNSQLIEGKGMVFGIKFKPGGFYPFQKSSISHLTNRYIGLSHIFDVNEAELENEVLHLDNVRTMINKVEHLMMNRLPEKDEKIVFINEIIEHIFANDAITKVETVCEHFKINKRQLQRLFDKYVGVSPKWVIKLYRLQNAAERIDHGHRNWVDLSVELNYYDQSHFIKDFKAIIGKTPEEYATKD